jgi:hypothetical protein
MFAGLLIANAAVWIWALMGLHGHPALPGTCGCAKI